MEINGTDLRAMRLKTGKTTTEMAQFAGVKTRKTYENWEKGISSPNVNQFIAMAQGCGFYVPDIYQLAFQRQQPDDRLDWNKARLLAQVKKKAKY